MTARLWILSDLHQDRACNAWDPEAHAPAGGFDILVVAGDVHMPGTSALNWLATRFPNVPIIYVLGNHDYWWDRGEDRYTLMDVIARSRDLAAKHAIHLLVDHAVVLKGVRFLGGTLWTDLRLDALSPFHGLRSAEKRMNDYRSIRRHTAGRRKFVRPADTLALHRATNVFLEDTLASLFIGRTVVVTHHAPHPMSLPIRNVDLNWCYSSDLTQIIESTHPDLWVHGHVHGHFDYAVGSTRIVCNARGHIEEGSHVKFRNGFVIEI